MAWVRIDDGAMQHPKVLGLSDSAFRLWIKGLCYCQSYLTDGLIPREALREMRAKRQDVESLSREFEGYSPLWEAVKGVGFRVHDYLEYNDSREQARRRQDIARSERMRNRQRMSQWRASKVQNETPVTPSVTPHVTCDSERDTGRDCHAPRKALTQPNPTQRDIRARALDDSGPDAATTKVAAEFCERYSQIYSEERHGARYPVREARDFPIFMTLAKTWPDTQRLEDMFRVFLHLPAKNSLNAQGTPAQFLHHAAECDSLLRQNGR